VACPAAARKLVGDEYDVEALAELLLRDEPFYRASGGGVTFSGGEPTQDPDFVGRLAERLVSRGVDLLLETCGHFAWEPFERHLLPHLQMVYLDLKLADAEQHRRYTGRGNSRILENLARLARCDQLLVLPRVPLVPGLTDTPENLEGIAEILVAYGLRRVALLPYHPLWVPKRRALGLELSYAHETWMPEAEVERCREVFRQAGVEVQ